MVNRWQVVSWITPPCSSGMLFQGEGLGVNWQLKQDSSMVELQARDLEIRVRVPVQVQISLEIL